MTDAKAKRWAGRGTLETVRPDVSRPKAINKRRPHWPTRLAVALFIGWAAIATYHLTRIAADVRSAERSAELARAQPAEGVDLASSGDLVRRASSQFTSAHNRLRSPIIAPLRALPFAGRQVRSLDALTGEAARLGSVLTTAVDRADALLDETAGRATIGPEAVTLLRRLGEVAAEAERHLAQPRLGPSKALVGPLAHARHRLSAEFADLHQALKRGGAGATATADLLDGPRRYLVLAANNAEMRAGSGMFLSAATLDTSGGDFVLSPFRSTAELPRPTADVFPLEADVAGRWKWLGPEREWANINLSPRFDVTAPLAARLWEFAGGGSVDGVLALDPPALQGLLSVVGPVEVDGQRIDSGNVLEWALHGQYVAHSDSVARREGLGRVVAAVLEAMDARPWNPTRLGLELAAAGRGRHLLLWSAREAEQRAWSAAGVAGSLEPDSLLVSVLNRGGNKLDWFMRVQVALEARRRSGGLTEATVRIRLRNDAPVGEPTYVVGPHPGSGAAEGDYAGIVAVNLPGTARNGRIDGEQHLVVAGPDGPTRVVGSFVRLARGESREIVVRFELPQGTPSLRVEPSARIPPVHWVVGSERWEQGSARHVALP